MTSPLDNSPLLEYVSAIAANENMIRGNTQALAELTNRVMQLSGPLGNVAMPGTPIGSVATNYNSTANKEENSLGIISSSLKSGGDIAIVSGYKAKGEGLKRLSAPAFGAMSDAIDVAKASKGIEAIADFAKAVAGFSALAKEVGAPIAAIGVGLKGVWDYSRAEVESYKFHQDTATFMTPAAIAGYPQLLEITDNAAYTKQLAEWTRQKPVDQINSEAEQYVQKFLKAGGELHFSERLAINDQAYLPAIVAAMERNQVTPGHPIKDILFDTPQQLRDFQANVDPLHEIKTRLRPMQIVPLDNAYGSKNAGTGLGYVKQEEFPRFDWMNSAHRIEAQLNSAVEKGLQGYRLYGPTYVGNYVQSLSTMFGNMPETQGAVKEAQARLTRGFSQIDREKAAKQTGDRSETTSTTKTINFNRALIEHFTINVKDAREGINDFKRKVEEALVEILNSINAK